MSEQPMPAGRPYLLDYGEFIETHVEAPLSVAESRDPKGLYAKARRGDLIHFTGIDSPYEPPESPELRLDTGGAESAATLADRVVERLRAASVLTSPAQV